jgi:chemotaxis protein CheY-P-specific phosphatase CheC
MERKTQVEEVFIKGINKSFERINKVSSSKWFLKNFSTGIKSGDFESVSVYLISDKKDVALVIVIKKDDVYDLVKFFVGRNIDNIFSSSKFYEFVVCEIGNIILNSILSEIANYIGVKIIPNVPAVLNGYKNFILENLSLMIEENLNKTIFLLDIVSNVENKNIEMEVYVMLSPEIVKKL